VLPLPLDRDPATLRGLIVLTTFASEGVVYREYMRRHAAGLTGFVQAGNVLLQLPQADQTEAQPPFLAPGFTARRHDIDASRVFALKPQHPLLVGVPLAPDGFIAWDDPYAGWETFVAQGGFEILAAGGNGGQNAALMEAATGSGRVLLSAMPMDKPVGKAEQRGPVANAFFANLRGYVSAVCQGLAPEPLPTPSALRPGFAADSTMLAVLPDTQIYTVDAPGVFTAQTSWIAANRDKRRIPYVLHLGDIVDQNIPLQWERAVQSMQQLDGVVPYAIVGGNHDYGPGGTARTRDTLMNQYFPFAQTAALPSFGGAFEVGKLDNTYHYVSVGGRDYIALMLEWGPRDEVIAWANQIMEQNQDRYGILVTHAYMYSDSRRYDHRDPSQLWNPHIYGTPGTVNDGEELWEKLVRRHRFVMVLNGHVLNDGTGYLASVTDRGNICHQMLSNYQFRALGGEGYLRLLEFLADGKTVRVYTYSPLYDSFLTEVDQNFSFTLDLPPGPRP
ncbi:MAG TPA: metallophosphoesterase, partial [Polyangia bacterium]